MIRAIQARTPFVRYLITTTDRQLCIVVDPVPARRHCHRAVPDASGAFLCPGVSDLGMKGPFVLHCSTAYGPSWSPPSAQRRRAKAMGGPYRPQRLSSLRTVEA
jgi:hypothetical protein